MSTSRITDIGREELPICFAKNGKVRRQVLSQSGFAAQLSLERMRAERSGRSIALLRIDCKQAFSAEVRDEACAHLSSTMCQLTRRTDVLGWHEYHAVLGVILTEFGKAEVRTAVQEVCARLQAQLASSERPHLCGPLLLSATIFPEPREIRYQGPQDMLFYPDARKQARWKRFFDLVVSLVALLLLAPLFALIGLAVRLNSAGPALYRQERIGQFAAPFTMYKFRTMRRDADCSLHKAYVQQFILSNVTAEANGGIYKIARDPRVTSLGRLLRKTSLDELPQLFNVFRGEMSLVGPRPPLRYEIDNYELWHRRRVLEAKPGLTGLWQTKGRSRIPFNEMVRLDLRYASRQSLLFDLQLILLTFPALLSDKGAR